MALAVLEIATGARVAADTRVLDPAHWHAIAGAQELHQRASAAVLRARELAREAVAAELRQRSEQVEPELHEALLRDTLKLRAEHERALRELRTCFVDTLIECLRSMLSPLPPAFFARVHESANAMLGSEPDLVLHVSARDEHAARLALAGPSGRDGVRVVVDPELTGGQCFLETRFGRIQAGLPTQLEALRAALDRWWSGPPDAGTTSSTVEAGR